LPASWQSVYTQMWHRKPLLLAFLALLGAPYIYDISSLRVKSVFECACFVGSFIFCIDIQVCVVSILYHATQSTVTGLVFIAAVSRLLHKKCAEKQWQILGIFHTGHNWRRCGLEAGFVGHDHESGLHKDVEYFD